MPELTILITAYIAGCIAVALRRQRARGATADTLPGRIRGLGWGDPGVSSRADGIRACWAAITCRRFIALLLAGLADRLHARPGREGAAFCAAGARALRVRARAPLRVRVQCSDPVWRRGGRRRLVAYAPGPAGGNRLPDGRRVAMSRAPADRQSRLARAAARRRPPAQRAARRTRGGTWRCFRWPALRWSCSARTGCSARARRSDLSDLAIAALIALLLVILISGRGRGPRGRRAGRRRDLRDRPGACDWPIVAGPRTATCCTASSYVTSRPLADLAGVQGLLLLAFGLWLVPRRRLPQPGPAAAAWRRMPSWRGRVQRLTESRAVAVDTAAADLRRLERDLHDGAQARLVALGMNLRAARAADPDQPGGRARPGRPRRGRPRRRP